MPYSSTAPTATPPVVLFGYASSPFTNKVRLVLKLKGVEYTYIPVPSMLPRPLLTSTFALTYRKIPVCLIGRHLYCDTSLIIEALEHYFPAPTYPSIYPLSPGGQNNRALIRGLVNFWFDRPLFRLTTGLIPPSVWHTSFGQDRGKLIGHALDPEKLGRKVPQNLFALDTHLSVLEGQFAGKAEDGGWVFGTQRPGLADVGLWYQLRWGWDIGAGRGIYNLSGGATKDVDEDIVARIFTPERYPGLWKWFHAFERHVGELNDVETEVNDEEKQAWKEDVRKSLLPDEKDGLGSLVPTRVAPHEGLMRELGLRPGVTVSVAPDDTGRDDPVIGALVALGTEEIVVKPLEKGEIDVWMHFPRVGFVVKKVGEQKL